jgi:hypothetical protein
VSDAEMKKPSISRGLFHGAGEEGRTPDLMLGNDKKAERRKIKPWKINPNSPAYSRFGPA